MSPLICIVFKLIRHWVDPCSQHFFFLEIRPGIGCRNLVQRSLYHILPGLLTDLDDWQAGPRLQAARLLAILILNADSRVTQYAEKVLTALYLAVGDKEANVVRQVGCCSCTWTLYLNYYVYVIAYLEYIN